MTESELVSDFRSRIAEFTWKSLRLYSPDINSISGKSIHDNVWGTNYYDSWEVALIDTPLIQRLRNIHQTGIAFFLYPSAVHTRFDHTLGVTSIVDRVIDSINREPKKKLVGYEQRCTLRIAALLHDIGHGPFSHVIEDLWLETAVFKAVTDEINREKGVKPKPHEIISYLIVSSDPFKSWFDDNIRKAGLMEDAFAKVVDLDRVADYIIGYSAEPGKKYLADIINGPMDADKLDYLARDAKFSGLAIGYDLDRYFKTIDIHRITENDISHVRLGVPLAGVNSLEQMILSRMMMFSSLYHHQKARAAECMMLHLFFKVLEGEALKGRLELNHPLDFLYYVDSDFLNVFPGSNPFKKEAGRLYTNLCQRNLMKRALIITRPFIKGIEESEETSVNYMKLLSYCKNRNGELREQLSTEATKISRKLGMGSLKVSVNDIIIDIPKFPSMEETLGTTVPIDSSILGEEKDIEIDELFPIKRWAEGYNAVKWRGHVFCFGKFQNAVNIAARKIFSREPFHIIFSENATILCKIPYDLLEEEK